MQRLFTLLAALMCISASAQVEFPWNPDADGDDFIGVNDLMALLGEFDSVFSEEALYLSEDELSAMYDVGTMNFLDCQIACKNLPGRWNMPEFEDVTVTGQQMWLKSQGYPNNNDKALFLTVTPSVSDAYVSYERGCFCVTKERPKVEYSFCDGGDPSDAGFTQCINEKLAEGWYPLSGFPIEHSRQGYAGWTGTSTLVNHQAQSHASFWRWAE